MKDYKEEIDLIVLELFGSAFSQGDMGMVTNKKAINKASSQIKSLIREIVQEAVNSHPTHIGQCCRSEILSNVEKLLK